MNSVVGNSSSSSVQAGRVVSKRPDALVIDPDMDILVRKILHALSRDFSGVRPEEDKGRLRHFYLLQKGPPRISIQDYIKRIVKYSKPSPEVLVLATYYIYYINAEVLPLQIGVDRIHQLFLASVMAAAKFMNDSDFSNSRSARVGGIELDEFNNLEADFLKLIGFRLWVSDIEYKLFYECLNNLRNVV